MVSTSPHTVAYCRARKSTKRSQKQADDREEQKKLQDLCHPLPECEKLIGWNLALDPKNPAPNKIANNVGCAKERPSDHPRLYARPSLSLCQPTIKPGTRGEASMTKKAGPGIPPL